MQTIMNWTEGLGFTASVDSHQIKIDAKAPLGKNTGPTPKDLVMIGLGGCTAMDVIALLKKHKQSVNDFSVTVEITPTEGQMPAVFKEALITYRASGEVAADKFIESVRLSQTKYCGVSAMLAKAFPIHYHVFLNGVKIADEASGFPGSI